MASYQTTKPSPTIIAHNDIRRKSTVSAASSVASTLHNSPRVQLVPHSRQPSYDASLSPSDIESLANTSFDSKDVSSKDFDFEDVFTYDKPQRKLKSVVEVSSSTRDWSNFSFSHYHSAVNVRQKHNRNRSSNAGEMLMKNQGDTRKR